MAHQTAEAEVPGSNHWEFIVLMVQAEVVVNPEGQSLLAETNGNYKELKKPDGTISPATPVNNLVPLSL